MVNGEADGSGKSCIVREVETCAHPRSLPVCGQPLAGPPCGPVPTGPGRIVQIRARLAGDPLASTAPPSRCMHILVAPGVESALREQTAHEFDGPQFRQQAGVEGHLVHADP